jgi:hypothetical protein
VDSSIVRFCAPGDPAALAQGITDILDHPDESKKRVHAGMVKARWYDWQSRMQRVLEGI